MNLNPNTQRTRWSAMIMLYLRGNSIYRLSVCWRRDCKAQQESQGRVSCHGQSDLDNAQDDLKTSTERKLEGHLYFSTTVPPKFPTRKLIKRKFWQRWQNNIHHQFLSLLTTWQFLPICWPNPTEICWNCWFEAMYKADPLADDSWEMDSSFCTAVGKDTGLSNCGSGLWHCTLEVYRFNDPSMRIAYSPS